MKKYVSLLLAAIVGGCVAHTVPAFADAANDVADATMMFILTDLETGARRTMICAPVNPPPIQQGYH